MTSGVVPASSGDGGVVDTFGRAATRSVGWLPVATLGVIGLAAVLYLVGLTANGFGNAYYAATALAGSQSWSAWFFGSVDPQNFITTDKPPLSTMVIALSVRFFGLSSASVLIPQALEGIAAVALLMASVRRTFGGAASIIAGLVLALTPVAVLMFRYDNPDALLTLLLVAGAYAVLRSIEGGRLRWAILAAALVGLAFDTKLLQAWLVLPAFGVTYAVAAPGDARRRIRDLTLALGTVVALSSWVGGRPRAVAGVGTAVRRRQRGRLADRPRVRLQRHRSVSAPGTTRPVA